MNGSAKAECWVLVSSESSYQRKHRGRGSRKCSPAALSGAQASHGGFHLVKHRNMSHWRFFPWSHRGGGGRR